MLDKVIFICYNVDKLGGIPMLNQEQLNHLMESQTQQATQRDITDQWKSEYKRKYIRKCGICNNRQEQSKMIRDNGSPNGWICKDCYYDEHWEDECETETEEF